MNSLEGKVAIVTGSGQGVGRGIALFFASGGCRPGGAECKALARGCAGPVVLAHRPHARGYPQDAAVRRADGGRVPELRTGRMTHP